MYFVAVEQGVRCAVRDICTRGRSCVVFVHGWPLDGTIFQWQTSVLPSYGIRCVSMDMRGFGDSDKPWSGYNYNRLADDLCRVITRLDVTSCVLCGFSMGAAVCIRYMARHKGYKVSRLVLAGAAAPSFVQQPGYPYGMSREQVDAMLASLYQDPYATYNGFIRQCFASNPSDYLLGHMDNICAQSALHAAIKGLECLRDEDVRSDLGQICVPTAILHGVQDQICPFPFAEELRKGIRDSYIVAFECSGHCLFYDEKQAFNSTLVDIVNAAPKSC